MSIAAWSEAICAALSDAELLAAVDLALAPVPPLPELPVAAELVLLEPEDDSAWVMALASVDSSEATFR